MKTTVITILLLLSGLALASAQSTAFTYNGRLNNNGAPVSGPYEMRFTLYDANVGGNSVAGPLLLSPVDVANGLFTTRIDFGANVFTGPARWLEIAVRPVGGAAFTALTPRQEVTSSPYAIRAQTAGSVAEGTVVAAQLATGGVAPTAGQFLSYKGGNLFWSDPAVAAGGIFSLNGTSAYYSAGHVGIGTMAPATALEVNGVIRSTRTGISAQYVQLDGGDSSSYRLTAQSTAQAEKPLIIQNLSGEANPGTNNAIYFMLGTTGTANIKMLLDKDGNVGIGSTTPKAKLEVVGQDALRLVGYQPFLTLLDANAGYARGVVQSVGGEVNLFTESYLSGANSFSFLKLANNGNVGIGSATPVGKLEVVAQDALRLIGYQPFLTLLDANAGYARSRIQGVDGDIVLEPESYVSGSNPNGAVIIAKSGNVSVGTLTIRGGADLAEPFDLSSTNIAKGSVVIIDSENEGHLRLSDQAYDERVAGVVSGANGVNPGISLHQAGVLDQGQNVALSGRVYVLADATTDAIKPGDLLTTSGTPGHAMKVKDHRKAQGAILGKAMSSLREGQGMVLVLVTLQ